jgi:hypothetical protein
MFCGTSTTFHFVRTRSKYQQAEEVFDFFPLHTCTWQNPSVTSAELGGRILHNDRGGGFGFWYLREKYEKGEQIKGKNVKEN